MEKVSARLPRSISHWLDPFIIVAILLFVYVSLRATDISNLLLAVVMVASVTVPMALIEFFRAPWSPLKGAFQLTPRRSFEEMMRETSLQWLGMLGYFVIILFAWWLLAEYYRDYYEPFFAALPLLMLVGPIATALVLFAAEWFCGPSARGGRELGLFIGRTARGAFAQAHEKANWVTIRDELLSWILLGFFLPINFVELVKSLYVFRGQELAVIFGDDPVKAQYFIIIMIYALLIAAITPGYLFGSRLIRTETRNVDHTWFGWTITLICYDPIVTAVFGRWFDYRAAVEGPLWVRPYTASFEQLPMLLFTFGALIIFCEVIHLWGEAQFGLRASNISNRGVISTGLFRLTKHPIFVSKCAGWLLIWIPFMATGDLVENLRLTMLWGCVCIIYVLRAVAEERVMAKDPDYVAYGLYMDKHGAFAWVGRLLPFMSFEYRLKKWNALEKKSTGAPLIGEPALQS